MSLSGYQLICDLSDKSLSWSINYVCKKTVRLCLLMSLMGEMTLNPKKKTTVWVLWVKLPQFHEFTCRSATRSFTELSSLKKEEEMFPCEPNSSQGNKSFEPESWRVKNHDGRTRVLNSASTTLLVRRCLQFLQFLQILCSCTFTGGYISLVLVALDLRLTVFLRRPGFNQ